MKNSVVHWHIFIFSGIWTCLGSELRRLYVNYQYAVLGGNKIMLVQVLCVVLVWQLLQNERAVLTQRLSTHNCCMLKTHVTKKNPLCCFNALLWFGSPFKMIGLLSAAHISAWILHIITTVIRIGPKGGLTLQHSLVRLYMHCSKATHS